MGRTPSPTVQTFKRMPHTLSDRDISLLLHHLLRYPADPALVPIIYSLHSSLVISCTTSSYSTTNSGELFHDFLGSGESPEDFNDWDTPPLPDPTLSASDLLDDRYSLNDANFERISEGTILDYISCCDYRDPAATNSMNDCGISPSLIHHEVRNTFVNIITLLISLFPDCGFRCFGS
jgi:hypothetical protein